MKDKKSIESRRNLIKSIAVGSGAIITGNSVPESWSRPVVNSVLLPAHAQTSGLIYSSTSLQTAAFDPQGNSMFAGVIEGLVPAAYAGVFNPDPNPRGCATIVGSDVDLFMQFFVASLLVFEISALIQLSGGSSSILITDLCGGANQLILAAVLGYSAAYMDILIGRVTYRFPTASSCVAQLPANCPG